jgi:membrane protease YdiL (CAAX protease family)
VTLLAIEFTSELLTSLAQASVLLACLPVTVVVLSRLVRQRGVGPTLDGAWPDVCWGREVRGFEVLCTVFLLHTALSTAAGLIIGGTFNLRELQSSAPAEANIIVALFACGQWLLTCCLVLLWMARYRRVPVATFGLTTARFGRSLRAGLTTLAAVMPLVIVTLFVAGYLKLWLVDQAPEDHPSITVIRQANAIQQVIMFLLIGLVLPFFEELFYRGFIQTSLMRTGRPAVAIVVAGLLFGAVHLGQSGGPTQAPALAVFGFALGYAYYRTRSLWAPVLMHALFNIYHLGLTVGIPPLVEALRGGAQP